MSDHDSFRLFTREECGLYLAMLASAIFFLFPITSFADIHGMTFDIGAGEARYSAAPDGQFYQKENANSLRMIDNVKSAGVSFQLNPLMSVGIHTANLGTVEIHALNLVCPDDDCSKVNKALDPTRAECKSKVTENCLYSWVSSGGARGITFDGALTVARLGAFSFDLRGALYAHKVYWNAVVENTDCRDNPGCWRYAYKQVARYQVRPVAGIGAKFSPEWAKGGYLAVSWDRFFGIAEHNEVTAGFKGDIDRSMIWLGFPL